MRLILDRAANGTWNMAVDEALLELAGPASPLTLRLYQWSPATLSLGYFQNHAERELHDASGRLTWLRRPSGGGAIVHDRDWTYSLIVPIQHRLARDHRQLYTIVHGVLIELFAKLGIHATLVESQQAATCAEQNRGSEPFLCFARRATGDVIVGPHKVAGSAQRKRHSAILQHGSLLLAASPAAPELLGLIEAAGVPLPDVAMTDDFPRRLAARFEESITLSPLTDAEREMAGRIEMSQFMVPSWNEKR